MGPPSVRVALLVASLLCLQHLHAAAAGVANSNATTQQYGDSYGAKEEPQPGPGDDAAYSEGPQSYELCPDPQPADSFKQAHAGHVTFKWQDEAEKNNRRLNHARAQSSPEEAWSSAAVRAAFNIDRRPTRDYKSTAAVQDTATLLPSKIKELDGFHGTFDPLNMPTFEGLAVGPHPHDPDMVFMLHAVNGVAQMFLAEKDGTPTDLGRNTKLSLFDLAHLIPAYSDVTFEITGVTAFYDPKSKRFAIVWGTSTDAEGVSPPVFMAVSQTRNPLGQWSVWALDLRPQLATGHDFCGDQPAQNYAFEFPQASFNHEGVFIGGSSSCNAGEERTSLAALYVMSKEALYSPPPSDTSASADIGAAIYLTRNSWYRSVTPHELSLTPDAFEPFNSIPAPSRPQGMDDMKRCPLFVMKVDNAHMSVATLTDEPIVKMISIDSAPKIMAVVVGKGADYAAAEGYSDGNAVMPQPNVSTALELNYLGMPDTYNGLVFWATHHEDRLYVATGEYWGYNTIRMPSIYWSIIKAAGSLCELTRTDHGLIASQDGLALAYPVIAARADGGALVAFSYSGKGTIAGGYYPAYPGVATAMVGNKDKYGQYEEHPGMIHIIKKGTTSLALVETEEPTTIPWGIGSAAQVCGDQMWIAVPIPGENLEPPFQGVPAPSPWYSSWITWQQL